MNIAHLLFSFQGRIRRLHFWMAAICVGLVYGVVGQMFFVASGIPTGHFNPNPMWGLIWLAFGVADIWISLALDVKRCHDRDKSGWWVLIFALVSLTIVGALWPLIELGFLDGTQGPNRFGPSPKGIGGSEAVAA